MILARRGSCIYSIYWILPARLSACRGCAGVVEGFAVSSSGKASLLWSAVFPRDAEAIVGSAAPAPHTPIYSYAKVSPQAQSLQYIQTRMPDREIVADETVSQASMQVVACSFCSVSSATKLPPGVRILLCPFG